MKGVLSIGGRVALYTELCVQFLRKKTVSSTREGLQDRFKVINIPQASVPW